MNSQNADVQVLVDAMIDEAETKHPGVEYTIVVDQNVSLLLPRDADRLHRTVDGHAGHYRGHVYRDRMVEPTPMSDDYTWLVVLSPVAGGTGDQHPATYYGDLRTGHVATELPQSSQ